MTSRSSENCTVGKSTVQTRDKIISLAYSAFAKKGYAKTSLKTISDELGITRPALYYHFTSKEDLFIAVYESLEIVANGDIDPVLASTNAENFKNEFKKYFERVFHGMRGDEERVRFVAVAEATATEMPALKTRVQANSKALLSLLEKMISHGMEIGVIPTGQDKKALAQYLSLLVYGMSEVMMRYETPQWDEIWPIASKALFTEKAG